MWEVGGKLGLDDTSTRVVCREPGRVEGPEREPSTRVKLVRGAAGRVGVLGIGLIVSRDLTTTEGAGTPLGPGCIPCDVPLRRVSSGSRMVLPAGDLFSILATKSSSTRPLLKRACRPGLPLLGSAGRAVPSSLSSSRSWVKAEVDMEPLDSDGCCHFPSLPFCIDGGNAIPTLPRRAVSCGDCGLCRTVGRRV
jgi:hypothetical protein